MPILRCAALTLQFIVLCSCSGTDSCNVVMCGAVSVMVCYWVGETEGNGDVWCS